MKDFNFHNFPPPGAMDKTLQPSRVNRCWNFFGRMRYSGKVQFIVGFALFVLLGTGVLLLVEGTGGDSPFKDLFSALWFTVVTITTVGYGDITPAGSVSRLFAMGFILVGIGLVGVITGSITSMLVESNRNRALGLVAIRHIRDHIVVCGWKRDIRNILVGILDTNRWISSHDLVLVTLHPPNDVGELKRERRLRGLHYVYGNPAARGVLEMARVAHAQRVIILADDMEADRGGDPDSRTVLAASAVEAVSPKVYTCTEIIRPHFVPYLEPAGVEEIVLGARNAHSLIVAASLGDGLANVATRFFPENGLQMRILPIPAILAGAPYQEVCSKAVSQGYLPIGLLENTGRLHDRVKERIDEALREADYREAISTLRSAAHLESNVPKFVPKADSIVPSHAKLIAILPNGQSAQHSQSELSLLETAAFPNRKGEKLVICGWKAEMASLLESIFSAHRIMGRPLGGITIIGALPDHEHEKIANSRALKKVRVVIGEPTDPGTLKKAEVGEARRMMVLTDPLFGASSQEADARNVMISVAVNELNPAAYKCVEIFNPDLAEHLQISHVEETIYTRRFQRLMLVQASLGTGLSSTIGHLFDPGAVRLRVMDFPKMPEGTPLSGFAPALEARGLRLVGVLEHAGNNFTHKKQYLHMAQSQARVKGAVKLLLNLKNLNTNHPVLHPDPSFVPGPFSRAILIAWGVENQ